MERLGSSTVPEATLDRENLRTNNFKSRAGVREEITEENRELFSAKQCPRTRIAEPTGWYCTTEFLREVMGVQGADQRCHAQTVYSVEKDHETELFHHIV